MIIQILKQTLMISGFVLGMMLIIEYINVQSKGRWSKPIRKNRWLQVILSAFFGMIPGCLGVYTVVSLYTHNIVGLGALTASMIATSGDEAFIMISAMPKTALLIFLFLFGIAILTGFIINYFSKGFDKKHKKNEFPIHKEESCKCYKYNDIINHLRHISFLRSFLLLGLALFMIVLIFSKQGHNHGSSQNIINLHNNEQVLEGDQNEEHTENHGHSNSNRHHINWIKITFLIITSFSLFVILTVPDHFLEEHLWKHIIKVHFLKIFIWTLIAFVAIEVINQFLDLHEIVSENLFIVLLIAILVGLIPESGPHLIFVSMFVSGHLPLGILLANSIVQDGHGSIPLFAENKVAFFKMKLINLIVGFIIGLIAIYF